MQRNVVDATKLRRHWSGKRIALICWVSFESRSIAALSLAAGDHVDIHIIRYRDVEYELRDVLTRARAIGKSRIKNESVWERDDQFRTMTGLRAHLDDLLSAYPKVIIDISCFPREALLMLVYALSSHKRRDQVQLVYNIAADYSVNEGRGSKWLGRGMKRISPVLGFSGRLVPGRSTTLVGLVGMDEERFVRLVEALEPNRLIVGIGKTEAPDKAWLTASSQKLAVKLKAAIPETSSFTFSCDTVESAYVALEKTYNKVKVDNVIVATLNNKISTLAAGVLSLKQREIQICSAPALIYNYQAYSRPGEKFIILNTKDLFAPLLSARPARAQQWASKNARR